MCSSYRLPFTRCNHRYSRVRTCCQSCFRRCFSKCSSQSRTNDGALLESRTYTTERDSQNVAQYYKMIHHLNSTLARDAVVGRSTTVRYAPCLVEQNKYTMDEHQHLVLGEAHTYWKAIYTVYSSRALFESIIYLFSQPTKHILLLRRTRSLLDFISLY